MSPLQLLLDQGDRAALAEQLRLSWRDGLTTAVVAPQEQETVAPLLEAALPAGLGPGVVLGTGGSAGARRWCLQPLAGLQRAATATAEWLLGVGLDPGNCELLNPLPLHHISGLMPLVRAEQWRVPMRCLPPQWLRDPALLLENAPLDRKRPALVSLVPTQLQRLLEDPRALAWLRGCAVIWVGGAALPEALAEACRREGLHLAPCYGSTETGAMVAAQLPQAFLAGQSGCGQPLAHAELQVDPSSGALQIRGESLAAALWSGEAWEPLPLQQGWWSSGDLARLDAGGLQLLGRLDGAIQSGGETVFPEQVELVLLQRLKEAGLPIESLLLLPEEDPLWGARLLALVRPAGPQDWPALERALQRLAELLPPAQRPRQWLCCEGLERNAMGKWERQRWRHWLESLP